MLKERIIGGGEREVDICVRGTVGGRPIVVCVECKDEKRRQGIQWIDRMHGTHKTLETNRLVLVSHSGFTKQARNKARAFGIDLLSLVDVDDDSPERLFPDVQSLWAKTWTLNIDRVSIVVDRVGDIPRHQVRAFQDNEIFFDDGSTLGTAKQVADALIRSGPINQKLGSEGRNDHTFAVVGWRQPMILGRRLCLKQVESQTLLPILDFQVKAKCTITVDEFPLRHGLYGEIRVAWGEGTIDGKDAILFATLATQGKLTLSLKTGSASAALGPS